MFARILGGLLFMGLGGVMCYYSYWIVQQFGRNSWAELNLGGTRNLILLIGFGTMVLGVLMMFGVFSLGNPADQVSGMGFVE